VESKRRTRRWFDQVIRERIEGQLEKEEHEKEKILIKRTVGVEETVGVDVCTVGVPRKILNYYHQYLGRERKTWIKKVTKMFS
jgi:hypothetical protein